MDRRHFLESVGCSFAFLPAVNAANRIVEAEPMIPQTQSIRIGCCTSMIASGADKTGIENIEILKQLGFDYIDLPIDQLMSLSTDEFGELKNHVDTSGIKCESCNNFLPRTIRVTGPEVEPQRIADYVEPALKRASQLGAKAVSFGNPPSRNVPEGFPKEKAWDQMVNFLRSLDGVARANDVTVAVEPINRGEANFINLTTEGLKLVKEVDRGNIKLLVDYYHWSLEEENADVILNAGDYIRHVHFARTEGRGFPKVSDPDYRVFFDALRKINYKHRISIEARTPDLKRDGAESLALLRKLSA
jgi:D-psicose/D-tagatose/L-ribulose 3-epimerase